MSEGTDEERDVREGECWQEQWAGLFDGMEGESNRECSGELSLWLVTLLTLSEDRAFLHSAKARSSHVSLSGCHRCLLENMYCHSCFLLHAFALTFRCRWVACSCLALSSTYTPSRPFSYKLLEPFNSFAMLPAPVMVINI